MRYPINTFAQLCERVRLNDWSFGYDYPPFIESPIRNEINRIGLTRLLNDMGSLGDDFELLPHWERIAQLIFEEARQIKHQMENLHYSTHCYPIMDRINEIKEEYQRLYEARIQKEKVLQAEIAKRKADQLAEKIRIQEHRNELKEYFKQIIDDFNKKDLEGKLEVIIQDVKRNPDAYPLDMLNMTKKEWHAVNPELRHRLIDRLQLVKNRKYKELIDSLTTLSDSAKARNKPKKRNKPAVV